MTTKPQKIIELEKFYEITLKPLEKGNIIELENKNTYQINDYKELIKINLSSNNISDISVLIGLTSLTFLDLSNNQISNLKPLSYLTNLKKLWLSNNHISDLRPLSGLTLLTELYLQSNQISDLNSISSLNGLLSLGLEKHQMSDLYAIDQLNKLEILGLSNNQISNLSPLSNLINLKELYLSHNHISDISYLKGLMGLNKLRISNNKISDIRVIINHPNFRFYEFDGNPLHYPPLEIADFGYERIKQRYKDVDKYVLIPLYEAKLLVVGEPTAGKTSLSKKLLDSNYIIQDGALHETIGVNIMEGFKVPYHKNPNQLIDVHIWDFGGQDKQYPLHQYFLKGKSAYVLLSLDREDNRYLDRWFSIIRLLAGNDNIINLVLNQKKRVSKSSNFDKVKYLRQGFNFQEHILDLSEDQQRFNILKDTIAKSISTLSHVGSGYPAYCIDITKAIDIKRFELKKDYLTYEEYEILCLDAGYNDTEVPKKALEYLDIIGKVVYYEDDSNLNNIIIINPHWIIDAIYAVITHKELDESHNKGRFTLQWLEGFLKKPTQNRPRGYKESESKHILNLMLKNHFDICYSFDNKNYLIPLCMPKNIADYQFNYTDALTLIFKYEVMPSGMVARVLVRLSDYIEEDLISSTAGVLRKDKCVAFLEEYYLDNDANSYIRVSVKGSPKDKKYFLNEIRNELLRVQKAWFDQLIADELIPCNCTECINSENKYYISKDQIEKYLKKDKPIFNVQCHESGEYVNVFNLLGEIMELKISEKVETLESFLKLIKENPTIIQNFNFMRDQFNFKDNSITSSLFGGKKTTQNNYIQTSEEYQELKQLIQELKEQIKDNEAWHQYFNDVMDNLEALENAENEEKLLQEKTKSKSLFDKLKRTHDWINNIGIPTNLIDKIEKFKELFEKLPDFL
jgi:internalin A